LPREPPIEVAAQIRAIDFSRDEPNRPIKANPALTFRKSEERKISPFEFCAKLGRVDLNERIQIFYAMRRDFGRG